MSALPPYSITLSATAALPDSNVHVGCTIVSDALIVTVTTDPDDAAAVLSPSDAIVAVAVGAVRSIVTALLSLTVVSADAPAFPALSAYVALNVTDPAVSDPSTV